MTTGYPALDALRPNKGGELTAVGAEIICPTTKRYSIRRSDAGCWTIYRDFWVTYGLNPWPTVAEEKVEDVVRESDTKARLAAQKRVDELKKADRATS